MATGFKSCLVRQNCHPECDAAINEHVNLELHASYVYMSMACYFDRGDVALKPCSLFFLRQSNKEREHAEHLLRMHNRSAGNPQLWNVPGPEEETWQSSLKVMECALNLAKRVRQSLLNLYQLVTEKHGHVCDFLSCDYLHEQVMFMEQLEYHIANLRKLGTPEDSLAESLFDKLKLDDSKN